ncbi:MAG: hypothetical protein WC979_03475 [Candidatus Pacearchaeota archaeon]|jgi:hypothetical protein
MEKIDPIIKDLGASAMALRLQESCTCSRVSYKHVGLFLILILVLVLASQRTFIFPAIVPQLLAILVSTSFIDNREKRPK